MVNPLFAEATIETISVTTRDREGSEAHTSVRVELDPTSPSDCELLTRQLCFWRNVTYRLYENRRPTVLGSLSSPFLADMCPNHSLKYQLINGKSDVGSGSVKPKWHQGLQIKTMLGPYLVRRII